MITKNLGENQLLWSGMVAPYTCREAEIIRLSWPCSPKVVFETPVQEKSPKFIDFRSQFSRWHNSITFVQKVIYP